MKNNRAICWAMENGPEKPSERFVLVVFAGHKNFQTGTAWPSAESVAALTGLSLRTVRTAIADLVAGGFLEVAERGGGRKLVTVYRVNTREDAPVDAQPEPGNSARVAQFPPENSATVARFNPENSATVARFPDRNSAETALNRAKSARNSARVAPNKSEEVKKKTEIESAPKRARKAELAEGWKPSAQGLEYAKLMGIENVEEERDRFVDHHRAKGSRFSDWDAAWRTWSRNARDFRERRGRVGHATRAMAGGSGASFADILAAQRRL
jgi:hypothetical protein